MTQTPGSAPLTVRRVIPAARERVFDAWLDPARLARFMVPGGEGHAVADVDPRVGGGFRIVMHHPTSGSGGVEHTGEYLLIDRPNRLVFTWRSTHTDNRDTRVTVDFHDRGDATEVVLTHEQLPARTVESHRNGWATILDHLEQLMVR